MPGRGSSHSVAADIQNIRKILDDYEFGFPIIKELIQNADDAGAAKLDIGWFAGFPEAEHPLLRGPLLYAVNDGPFTKSNAHALKNLGLSDKPSDSTSVGKFGIGLKSLFHLCEAFFLIGSDGSGAPPVVDIYNPWSPQLNSDELECHGEWDAAEIQSEWFINFLRNLHPNGPWESPEKGWFCLWVPLRKEDHCKNVKAISSRYPGDDAELIHGLIRGHPGDQISPMMPMLHHLDTIRIWKPDSGSFVALEADYNLSSGSIRSKWNRQEADVLPERLRFKGLIEAKGEGLSDSLFAGIEVCPDHIGLKGYRYDDEWPSRIEQKPDGAIEDIPEKAAPHASVCFTKKIDDTGQGSLTTTWSVFLPVGTPEIRYCDIPLQVNLALHGYFFVDSGRSRIDFPEESQGQNGPIPIARKWNGTLRDEVLLPELLPAVDFFVESAGFGVEATTALTKLLQESPLWRPRHRPYICKYNQWIFQVNDGAGTWSLIGPDLQVLDIPEGSAELVNSVFPELTGLELNYCITFSGFPRLSHPHTFPWPEVLLERSLRVSSNVFEDEIESRYFVDFLEARKSDILRYKSSQDALVDAVRTAGQLASAAAVRENREMTSQILSHIPRGRLFSLPIVASPLGDRVAVGLANLDVEALLVSEELLPESYKSPTAPEMGNAISVEDGEKALTLLSNPPEDWLTDGYDQLRNNLALAIVRGVGEERENLLQRCADQALFQGTNLAAGGSGVFSYHDLSQSHSKAHLFSQGGNLPEHLQSALAEEEILLIPQHICSVLFNVIDRPSRCTPKACIETILGCKALAPESVKRVPLLQELLRSEPNAGETDWLLWVQAIRYLLHGDFNRLDNEALLIIWDDNAAGQVWGKLASAALDAEGEKWRLVPDALAQIMTPQFYASLGFQRLSREAAIDLIAEVGPQLVSCKELTEPERNQVIREIEDDSILRMLPVHLDTGNILRPIGPNTYLQGGFPNDDPIAKSVDIIVRRSEMPAVELRQEQLVEGRVWDSRAALTIALGLEEPHRYAASIVEALKRLEGVVATGENLRKALSTTPWLVTQDDSVVTPEDVIHLQDLSEELGIIAGLSGGVFVHSGALRADLKEPTTLALLARYAFFPRRQILVGLGQVLGEQDEFRIGINGHLGDDSKFVEWLSVFDDAEELRAVAVIKQLVDASNGSYRSDVLRYFLPELQLPLSPSRYISVLNFLADRHESQRANRVRHRLAHNWYLEDAARHPEFRNLILPGLNLLSQLGTWKRTTELCAVAENITQDDVLNDDQHKIISNQVHVARIEFGEIDSQDDNPHPTSNINLVDYLRSWENFCPRVTLGAFAALLGDDAEVLEAADEWFSDRIWQVEGVRNLFGWEPQPQRHPDGWIAADTISQVMETQRFEVQLVPSNPGAKVRVTNLVGETFWARLGENIEHLIVGGVAAHAPVSVPVERTRTAQITLRMIDPRAFQENLENVLKSTAQFIWKEIFLQGGGLDKVWQELGSEDQLGVLAARSLIEENLLFHMGQLRMPHNDTLEALRRRWREIRNRDAEANRLSDIGIKNHTLGSLDGERKKISDDLGYQLEEFPEIQDAFHQAVLRTVSEAKYSIESVPFELFQNADDATKQLSLMQENVPQRKFVILASENRLTFVHWGRRINLFRMGKFNEPKFANDLENMLVMHASDKASDDEAGVVTGNFGLGFKSIFQITKNPRVLSGTIGFEVVGGVLPISLSSDSRKELVDRLSAAGLDHHDATIIDLPLNADQPIDINKVLDRFRLLAPILHVFSRCIRSSEVNCPPKRQISSWDPRPLPGISGIEVGDISLRDGSFTGILFRASDNSAILFLLNGQGVERLPQEIPSIWVTAPTLETPRIGFAINGLFGIHPGRTRLADSGPETEKVVQSLGESLRASLTALVVKSNSDWEVIRDALCLDQGVTPYKFWSSFWHIVGYSLSQLQRDQADSHDVQIAKEVFWNPDSGAMPEVLKRHRLLPSGLPGTFSELCSLGEIQFQVRGCLENKEVFEQVATWPSFQSRHKPGTLISFREVGNPLRSLMPGSLDPVVITLKEALQAEVQDQRVSPEIAELVGITLSTTLLNGPDQDNQPSQGEREELLELMHSFKFLTKSGSWELATSLVTSQFESIGNQDEPYRAAFAPNERILSNDYGKVGAEFFRLCRAQLNVDVKVMADWALALESDDLRCQSVLNYLLRGERFRGVAQLLVEGKQGTWLSSLTFNSPHLAAFSEHERAILLGLLHNRQLADQSIAIDHTVIVSPQHNPGDVLNAILRWWEQDRDDHIAEYEKSVYPGGTAPILSTDLQNLKSDINARQNWLELFVLGATFTLGRTKPEQHRDFLRQWRARGWLREFANPATSRTRWIQILEEYFQASNDRQDYFHWLRLFVNIYQLSNWLDTYIELFLDMQKRGQFDLHNSLILRQDNIYQGGGLDAPSLVSTLGYGACFVIRELARQNILTSTDVEQYCYVPQARLRRFLKSLGCSGLEPKIRTEGSTIIYWFLQMHLGDNATFGGDFDLPLQIAAADDNLWIQFLGGDPPIENGAEEEDYDD